MIYWRADVRLTSSLPNCFPLCFKTPVSHSLTFSHRNFGLKLNGSVRSNRRSFEKISLPFEVDHFSWLDRSDRNGPFHLTISIHSQFQDLARCLVLIFHVQNGGKYLSLHFYGLLTANLSVLLVHPCTVITGL